MATAPPATYSAATPAGSSSTGNRPFDGEARLNSPITDIPGKRRIPDIRMDDARTTGADIVAVACPQCTAMLEGVVGKRPEVLDVAELVARALEVQP